MQRAIVTPAGSQHERLAVPIRKQRHTCRSASATQHVGLSAGRCCLLAACCVLAHTRRLHRPSYHCHTVVQFHLETEHSSKPSQSRVSQRLRAHQDEMIYGPRTYASLVANTYSPRDSSAPGNDHHVGHNKSQSIVTSRAASIAVSVPRPRRMRFL